MVWCSPTARFSKKYKSDLTESGVGAGIFGDVDTLRKLAEAAMNDTIDKMLIDPEFIDALSADDTGDAGDRMKRLEALYKDGHISEKEYQEKRAQMLSSL